MAANLQTLSKHKSVNGWPLFRLIVVPTSLVMLAGMLLVDTWSGSEVSALIQLSVRFAVPWLFLAFAASSIQILFPGPLSLWLARNRKYLGLAFAAAMAWQALFILWMVIGYTDYYVDEVYVLRDAIEGVIGYAFLLAMTVTSFMPVRKHMTPGQWKLLHKSGMYFLWAYAFSTYWWSLYYYAEPVTLDYVFYWAGFTAWALRVAAWSKKRSKQARKSRPYGNDQPAFALLGYTMIGAAVFAAGLGSIWRPAAENILYGYSVTEWLELYMPYWPFEPFLPLLAAVLGGYLLARARGGGRVEA
ncbi:MAG: hypothetical protein AAFX56_06550 [Pseudomonadota bacterium]